MKFKVGIIGYGHMGRIRHKAIEEIGKAEVIAISEQSIGVGYQSIPNLKNDEIVNHPNIDIVIVCTPNYLNKELTIRSLKAGKHVFCEKPPCFTGKDMVEIIEVEKASSKKLMYGFNHRHHDSIIKMKELVTSNAYGSILWMRGRYGKSVTKDYFNNWRAKKELAGGGILIDQGIHMLDLLIYFGGNFNTIKAEVSNLYWNLDVEDNAFVILKNKESGVVASLHSTMTQWRHLFALEVFMERGYMVLNGLLTSSMSYGEEILSIAKNRSTAPAATWQDEEKIKYLVNNSWRYEMGHFINSIENNVPVEIGNSNDALKLMAIMDKIYEQKDC